MKKIYFTLICCLPFWLQAQTSKYTELGFNTSPLLTTFISIGQVEASNPPVAFTWKRVKNNGRVLRMGIGFNLRSETGFIEPNTNKFFFNIGFERRRNITEKWKYYWGGDLIFNRENNFRERSLIGDGVGLGPILGIRYVINDKISFSTESTLYLVFGDETFMSFIPPTSIYFNVQFKKRKRIRRRDRIADEF